MINIKLKYPVEQESFFGFIKSPILIEYIKIRRPKTKDIIGLDFTDPETAMHNMMILIGRLSGHTTELVSKIDLADFNEISIKVNRMIEGR